MRVSHPQLLARRSVYGVMRLLTSTVLAVVSLLTLASQATASTIVSSSGCVSTDVGALANAWGQGCARLGAVGARVVWSDVEDTAGFSNVFSSPDPDIGTFKISIVCSQRPADASVGLAPNGDQVAVFSASRGGNYAIEQYAFNAGQPNFNVLHLSSTSPLLPANWGHLLAYAPRGLAHTARGPRICLLGGSCRLLPPGPGPTRRLAHSRSGIVGLALHGDALAVAWLTESTDAKHPYFETDILYNPNVLANRGGHYDRIAHAATTGAGASVFSPSLTADSLYFVKGARACSVPSASAQLERWNARTHRLSATQIPPVAAIARGATTTYAALCPPTASANSFTSIAALN